jgi:hypothetical protein
VRSRSSDAGIDQARGPDWLPTGDQTGEVGEQTIVPAQMLGGIVVDPSAAGDGREARRNEREQRQQDRRNSGFASTSPNGIASPR